jgi:hypothetical protein
VTDRSGSKAARRFLSETVTAFLDEIGPAVYTQALVDMQSRLQLRVSELDLEVREGYFSYRPKYAYGQNKPRI